MNQKYSNKVKVFQSCIGALTMESSLSNILLNPLNLKQNFYFNMLKYVLIFNWITNIFQEEMKPI